MCLVVAADVRSITSKGKYLFPKERKSYLHDGSLLSRRIKRFFKNTCDIETQDENTAGQRKNVVCRVGFHSLRHSFVSLCAARVVGELKDKIALLIKKQWSAFRRKNKLTTCPESFASLLEELLVFLQPLAVAIGIGESSGGHWSPNGGWQSDEP